MNAGIMQCTKCGKPMRDLGAMPTTLGKNFFCSFCLTYSQRLPMKSFADNSNQVITWKKDDGKFTAVAKFGFIFLALGLLACAGSRELDSEEHFYLSQERDMILSFDPTEIGNTTWDDPKSPLPAASQKFSVHVNIIFPKMTLQQAAELEAKLKKLLPEAQEISFYFGQDVEMPVENFYWMPNDGANDRTVPGIYPQFFDLPQSELKPGKVLKIDSTGVPVWQEF